MNTYIIAFPEIRLKCFFYIRRQLFITKKNLPKLKTQFYLFVYVNSLAESEKIKDLKTFLYKVMSVKYISVVHKEMWSKVGRLYSFDHNSFTSHNRGVNRRTWAVFLETVKFKSVRKSGRIAT